ncbi:MAG: asparagine synthase (glutamine-hydrolyzing) [Acidobacteriota bacterium]
MCGLAGFLGGISHAGQSETETLLRRMADTLVHRGPDDFGSWFDAEQQIALAFRRLSIVDLTSAGHQPMESSRGRYVITFNGEIYNQLSIRAELERAGLAPDWHGHCDTETLLAGFDAWGIQETIERALGMFAIVVWDKQTRTLTLVRDRVGEKPLYFGWQGNTFLFGSELKALRAHPAFVGSIDRGALTLFMRHSYVPAPYSIYHGIFKQQPGCILSVSLRQREPKIWTYWSGADVAASGQADLFRGSPDQAVDELEMLLKDAIAKQMVADVPLGAFLSGGVDSSTVVALMQAQSALAIKTFSIGFTGTRFNEAEYAKAVARHVGTDHTELHVTPEHAMAVIPLLPSVYDEPFADSSQIPTYLVSQLARQHVTVSLSGDGGDELFCGYNRYRMTAMSWRLLHTVPMPLRRAIQKWLTGVSPLALNNLVEVMENWLPRSLRMMSLGDKLQKSAAAVTSSSADALYLSLVSQWQDPESLVLGGHEPPTRLTQNAFPLGGLDVLQSMMALDLLTYLPADILVKIDRAAMRVSLETRIPFLDHRLIAFAWRLPMSMKLRDGQSKWVLRQVLSKHVPRQLIDRPKMGFAVPIDSWLRGPLRAWAEDLLDERMLRHQGYLDPAIVQKKWREHLRGSRNWQDQLWCVLMFQAWLQKEQA